MKRICMFVLVVSLIACGAPQVGRSGGARSPLRSYDSTGDLFKDRFVRARRLYVNEDTGMNLQFNSAWVVYSNYNQFPAGLKPSARTMRESDRKHGVNGEMVLLAHTRDKRLWLRIITEEVGFDVARYYSLIRKANDAALLTVTREKRTPIALDGRSSILWEYTVPKGLNHFRFVEYQVAHRGFNSRISFWTLETLMAERRASVSRLVQGLKLRD